MKCLIDADLGDTINSMMKLIKKNRRAKDCGVVAAFNAASWCNKYQPYSAIEKQAASCGYNRSKGIYNFQFSKLLKKLDLPAKKVWLKSVKHLESNIYLGKFYALLYRPAGYDLGHVIVTFLDHKGIIRVINPDSQRLTWDDLAAEIHANGMCEFHVYEIPGRHHFKAERA
jgi:hypothetical protein